MDVLQLSDFRLDVHSVGDSHQVLVTHQPTGLVAGCSDYPGQLRNRHEAIRRLGQRLAEHCGDPTLVRRVCELFSVVGMV